LSYFNAFFVSHSRRTVLELCEHLEGSHSRPIFFSHLNTTFYSECFFFSHAFAVSIFTVQVAFFQPAISRASLVKYSLERWYTGKGSLRCGAETIRGVRYTRTAGRSYCRDGLQLLHIYSLTLEHQLIWDRIIFRKMKIDEHKGFTVDLSLSGKKTF
jgi:hypothetical protein